LYSPLKDAVNELAGIALNGFLEITPKDTAHIAIKKRQPINPMGNFFIAAIHFFNISFIETSPSFR
jgi:hypothetical protein